MAATFTNWTRRCGFVGTPGTTSVVRYAGVANFIAAGTRIGTTSGFFDYVAAAPLWQGDVWNSGAAVDDSRGDFPGVDQFVSIIIESLALWQCPAVLFRATQATGDGFMVTPWIHGGGYEIADFTAGAYLLLALGGSVVDVIGDKLSGSATLTGATSVLAGFLNDVAQITVASALHQSGDVGLVGPGTVTGNAGSDFRFGNGATLDGLEVDESSGFPIVISSDLLSGEFVSDVLEDPSADACPWWSALVEVHEEEIGHLVGDADYAAGSGEARWRGVYTREATEARPGGDFDWTVGAATQNVEDAAYRVCGRRGMHGRNTRAKVWTRFRVASVWGSWIEGAWVGARAAEAMQIRVELDRVSLEYQIRMTRVLLAVAS